MSEQSSPLARGIWGAQAVTVVAAAAVTIAISVVPELSFGYRNADLHLVLETSASVIAGLAAYLVLGRFRRSGTLSDLALTVALWVLALANVAAALAPGVSEGRGDEEAVWVPLWVRVLAAVILALAAFAPERRLRRPRAGIWVILTAMALTAAVAGAAAILAEGLSTGIDPNLSPAASEHPRVVGSAGLLTLQLVTMALAVAASVGFSVRARRNGDELLAWIALAATFAAFGRLNYFLFPSVYSNWVFTGDLFRFGLYLLILIGALRQITHYQRAAAEAAVLEERRRIARDLHDGLAQDLAFISMQASKVAESDERAAPIAQAADHALADSRGAIAALTQAPDEPLGASVGRLASALGMRSGIDVQLDIDEEVDASSERREAILRILSEAISNAVRHGAPSTIVVRLSTDPHLRLAVSDDGRGFDPADESGYGAGTGLAGMTERASNLGGGLVIRAQPGEGTSIEVVLP